MTTRARRRGCLNCRARRQRCDQVRPVCSSCQSCNNTCKWDEPFTFRPVNVTTGSSSSTTIKRRGRSSTVERSSQRNGETESELQVADVNIDERQKRRKSRNTISSAEITAPVRVTTGDTDEDWYIGSGGIHDSGTVESSTEHESHMINPPTLTEAVVADSREQLCSTSSGDAVEADKLDLDTLDYLTSHISNLETLAARGQSDWSSTVDSTPLKTSLSLSTETSDMSSVNQSNVQSCKLRSALQQHMVETARNTALNWRTAPQPEEDRLTVADLTDSPARIPAGGRQKEAISEAYLNCDLVTPQRQLLLWQNYLDEIAPWLDMFDRDRHFQTTIPMMAKSTPHLHYSILSLSARQIERRSLDTCYFESLGLYQRAIQLIVHRIQNLETEVITSCVLLCVLEMMSSSPRAWARHLDGCAMLLEAARIHGLVGGVREALFWCFSRMDLWAGYLGDTFTKIPTNRWFVPSSSMANAVDQFKGSASAESYANYAVFLCASVINVISTQVTAQTDHHTSSSYHIQHKSGSSLYVTRWKALYELLEDWYNHRPCEMLVLMYKDRHVNDPSFAATREGEAQAKNPFPIILYTNSPATSGNQMYHAAMLLMLQHKPHSVQMTRSHKSSVLWHARQICGIASSNDSHGAWVNALQPLWMAGKVMSHSSEHNAILNLLYRIERETGFATAWRADDLKEYWGFENEYHAL